ITESHNEKKSEDRPCGAYRRFTTTIRGWTNFKIYEGFCDNDLNKVIEKVKDLRDRIDAGDWERIREMEKEEDL
ncbi:MAG: hypothetical protein KAX20_04890, partial [Candidatus Omnitrophica bacterium]|nr:hypothetical protein [Candidatus Omnitrophota bacterium]